MTTNDRTRARHRIAALVAVVFVAGAMVYAKYSIQAELEQLNAENTFIRREIGKLERETDEVRSFKDELNMVIAHAAAIKVIDAAAVPAAEAMAALSRLPAQVRVVSAAINGRRMSVLAEAGSDADAAGALQAWSASPVVRDARIAASGPAAAAGKRSFRMEAEISLSPKRRP